MQRRLLDLLAKGPRGEDWLLHEWAGAGTTNTRRALAGLERRGLAYWDTSDPGQTDRYWELTPDGYDLVESGR